MAKKTLEHANKNKIIVEEMEDGAFKVTVKRRGKFLGDAEGFATEDYAIAYAYQLIREFPDEGKTKAR